MINEETIRKWWNVFVNDNGFTEIRILGRFQYSGYFDNVDSLISAIKPYADMDDEQLYFVLNKIDESCYSRQQSGKIIKSPKITTNDNDITRRHWVLCDFDPVRKSGTNSSDAEFELAHKKAQDVFRFLRDRGFNDPVICRSGNGWHNLYYIDEEVNDETKDIIRNFFKYMGTQFTDEKVDFDEKNFNEARICKLYGTMAKKGANLQDRPWRMSEIVYVPEEIKATPLAKFKELADLVPKEEPKVAPNRRQYQGVREQFDLVSWLNEHGISYKEERQGASTRFTLEECPWIDSHSDRKKWDSALFLDPNGLITFNCQHSHCKHRTWHDFREFYEPGAYDRPTYQPQYTPQPMVVQKQKYEIKKESPELGKKWLSLSDIPKIDISSLEKVKTGIIEIDRRVLGLFMSAVTLLSGGNGAGKSSLLNTLICNFVQQNYPTALWTGELPPQIFKAWLQMVAAGKNNLRLSQYGDGKYYVPNGVAERIDRWLDGKFFLFNNEYGAVWDEIFHDMTELLKIGVKIFILDNLFSLDIDLLEGDKNNKQKELIIQIKNFAKKNNVHVILVAHPRKTTTFLRKNDISGTSDLTNAVDNVWICHRINQDFFKSGAEFYGQAEIQRFQGFGNAIEICKERMFGVVDLMVGMSYEVESRRFKNTQDENIRYGWEDEPTEMSMSFDDNKGNADYDESLPFQPPQTDGAPF